jgi:transposase InsO family protein
MEGDKSTFSGTFYYFCRVLEGYSRYIVHWDLRESMTEADVEIILQAAREKYPEARPRIISDNGPQFIARDSCLRSFTEGAPGSPRESRGRWRSADRHIFLAGAQ